MLTVRPQITFDASNPEHTAWVKRTLESGKLDPQFRFHLEDGFESVLGMVLFKMAQAWMDHKSGQISAERQEQIRNTSITGTVVGFKSGTSRKGAHIPMVEGVALIG